MESMEQMVQRLQASGEKRVDQGQSRHFASRVPSYNGDDMRGAGIRLVAATAGTAVNSPQLVAGKRYKWRYDDWSGVPQNGYMRTTLASAPAAAAATDFPMVTGDDGYLFVPPDGEWDTVSALMLDFDGIMRLVQSDEKDEDAI